MVHVQLGSVFSAFANPEVGMLLTSRAPSPWRPWAPSAPWPESLPEGWRWEGEGQDETMLPGSELEGRRESQCEGILGVSEAHCFPWHRGKQAQRGQGASQNHNDARSLGSASPHLRLSYRCKGEDFESPSPFWKPLGQGTREESYGRTGRPRKGLPGGMDAAGDLDSPWGAQP